MTQSELGARPTASVSDATYEVGDSAECANCGAEIIVGHDGWWTHNFGGILCAGTG